MASKPPSDPAASPTEGSAATPPDDKLTMPLDAGAAATAEKLLAAKAAKGDKSDKHRPADDDDDDEDLVVFTAREAAGALATMGAFVRPYLGNYRKMLAIVGFGVLVETLFNVIMPLSLKYLIDDALGEEDFGALYVILGVLAVAGIFTSIVAIWYERWDARLAAAIVTDIRAKLFGHVQDLPSAYFARTKRGEILSRFSIDMAAIEGSIKSFSNSALLPFLELVAGCLLMLWLNWQLAAIALLVFPITLIGPRILTPKAVQANYEQKQSESTILGLVQENVAAQAVVKAFSLQRRTMGWFTLRNDDARRKIAAATFLSTMVERSVTISVLLLHLVVLAIGAYLATKGQITVGTFVTFESAFWEVSYNIAHLMHFIPVSISSAAAVRHIQELLDEPTRGADKPNAPELPRITNDITFDRVTFKYEGATAPVLNNLSLKLKVGKTIAVVGPSGSGKSTLLRTVNQLENVDDGAIYLDGSLLGFTEHGGHRVRLPRRRARRQATHFGMVFQTFNLIPHLSALENVTLGPVEVHGTDPAEARRQAVDLLGRVGLSDRVDHYPSELSGGQQQRVAIARALAMRPTVMLFDEPTSALDAELVAEVLEVIRELARDGMTMLIVTHELAFARDVADTVVMMDNGEIVESGPPERILTSPSTDRARRFFASVAR